MQGFPFGAIVTAACLLAVPGSPAPVAAGERQAAPVPWNRSLRQKPDWYGSGEAIRIGENVLRYQHENGGWPKNIDMAIPLSAEEQAALPRRKKEADSTIDNGATVTQTEYLARVFNATRHDRFRQGFLRGLDYLLAAQYPNGGWPQYYPLRRGYHRHITFNDDAMVGVMKLLHDVARRKPGYAFVDEGRRARSEKAVERGVACILRCQIVVRGRRTVWCAQHDEKTLAPAPARAYEKASLSGYESANIVRFLMRIDRPGPEVIQAIQAAVAWFEAAKQTGIRVVNKPDAALPDGSDRQVVEDPTAPPLWARFYEIDTGRPIFCGRDGMVKYRLSEIERERRTGYAWYTDAPARLLSSEYPAWRKRWAPQEKAPRQQSAGEN